MKRKRGIGFTHPVPNTTEERLPDAWYFLIPATVKPFLSVVGYIALFVACVFGTVYYLDPAFTPTIGKGLVRGLPEPWIYRILSGGLALVIAVVLLLGFISKVQDLMERRSSATTKK